RLSLSCRASVSGCGAHRALPSFPTRRSSDLAVGGLAGGAVVGSARVAWMLDDHIAHGCEELLAAQIAPRFGKARVPRDGFAEARSEEHTSELQSLTNIVFRLLL